MAKVVKVAKKAVAKKGVKVVKKGKVGDGGKEGKKKEPVLKYDDKSAGQPELVPVFEAIKKMIAVYDNKRALKLHTQTYGQALLISHKPVEIGGKLREELWFVSALIQKGYVGFYLAPPYPKGEMKKHFSEGFVKSLKGKSCFHIKSADPVIMGDIKKAIKVGYEAYVEKGLI